MSPALLMLVNGACGGWLAAAALVESRSRPTAACVWGAVAGVNAALVAWNAARVVAGG